MAHPVVFDSGHLGVFPKTEIDKYRLSHTRFILKQKGDIDIIEKSDCDYIDEQIWNLQVGSIVGTGHSIILNGALKNTAQNLAVVFF